MICSPFVRELSAFFLVGVAGLNALVLVQCEQVAEMFYIPGAYI